jgi:hypothetical protein
VTTFANVRASAATVMLPGAAVLVLGAVTALSYTQAIPIEFFTKDMAALTRVHPFISVISSLGTFMYVIAAAISLFACAVAARSGGRRPGHLLYGGILSSYLAVDDFYMLHEFVLPRYTGIGEKLVYAALATAILFFLYRYRSLILALKPALLLAALACFGGSVLSDLLGDSLKAALGSMEYLLEDGLKFIGISLWAAWFVTAALQELVPRAATVPPAPAAP